MPNETRSTSDVRWVRWGKGRKYILRWINYNFQWYDIFMHVHNGNSRRGRGRGEGGVRGRRWRKEEKEEEELSMSMDDDIMWESSRR